MIATVFLGAVVGLNVREIRPEAAWSADGNDLVDCYRGWPFPFIVTDFENKTLPDGLKGFFKDKRFPKKVDVIAGPETLINIEVQPEDEKWIKVVGMETESQNAGRFPMQCEGNLKPSEGGGGNGVPAKPEEKHWAVIVSDVRVEILEPSKAWIKDANRFDFQALKKDVIGFDTEKYKMKIKGVVKPIPPYGYAWTLEPKTAGRLENEATAEPTHIQPDAANAGNLTGAEGKLTLTAKGTDLTDSRQVLVYESHLARDFQNFDVGTSCAGQWTFERFGVKVKMLEKWNCHGSAHHHYTGTLAIQSDNASIEFAPMPNGPFFAEKWEQVKVAGKTDLTYPFSPDVCTALRQMECGDIVSFYSKDRIALHTHTSLGGELCYGANNQTRSMTRNDESWKWARCTTVDYANSLAQYWRDVKNNPRWGGDKGGYIIIRKKPKKP